MTRSLVRERPEYQNCTEIVRKMSDPEIVSRGENSGTVIVFEVVSKGQ